MQVPIMSDQNYYYTVYKITNLVNGKIYVGKHQGVDPYADEYFGSGKVIKQALRKYGKENFRKEILYVFETPEEAYIKEREIVDKEFLSRNDTYNQKEGGQGGFDHIDVEQQSILLKELWQNQDFRKKVQESQEKANNDPKVKERRSKAQKIAQNNPETKRKISERLKQSHQNPETKEKHSEALRKANKTSEVYNRKCEAQRRANSSPEARKKKSDGLKGKIWIYSESKDIQTKLDKNLPIPEGYRRGQRPKTK